MIEIITNSFEFVRSAVTDQRRFGERLAMQVTSVEHERWLSAQRCIGRIILMDYHTENPIYEDHLPEFKQSMIDHDFNLADLNLRPEELDQLQNLTGLK